MVAKTKQNFTMWSGDHKELTFTTTDSDSASVDLTGTSVIWQLSETPTSGSLVKRSTDSGCGISISGCTYTVSLCPTHTSGLVGIYYHESQVRDTGSNVSTVAVGWATINVDAVVD